MPPLELPPVCILAGGRGTRLGELTSAVPKPLIEVAGRPFLDHQLALLAGHGIRRAVLCVGYLGEQIEQALGPVCHGVALSYSYDGPDLDGTLGAIRRALPLLGERFLILYGDTYLRIDYRTVATRWLASGFPGLMTVLRNEGRWDTSNAILEGEAIVAYDKERPTAEMHGIDYGLGGLRAQALAQVAPDTRELATLYHVLAERGELFGVLAQERFFEIGSPKALAEAEEYLLGAGAPKRS